jgi:hypothetical protein
MNNRNDQTKDELEDAKNFMKYYLKTPNIDKSYIEQSKIPETNKHSTADFYFQDINILLEIKEIHNSTLNSNKNNFRDEVNKILNKANDKQLAYKYSFINANTKKIVLLVNMYCYLINLYKTDFDILKGKIIKKNYYNIDEVYFQYNTKNYFQYIDPMGILHKKLK